MVPGDQELKRSESPAMLALLCMLVGGCGGVLVGHDSDLTPGLFHTMSVERRQVREWAGDYEAGEWGASGASKELGDRYPNVATTKLGAVVLKLKMGGQPVKLILDTGSSAMVVSPKLKPPQTCNPPGGPFTGYDPDLSHTKSHAPCKPQCKCVGQTCQASVQYADKSHGGGPLYTDTITMGPNDEFDIGGAMFSALEPGSTLSQCGPSGYDGIIGVGYRILNCHPPDSKYCPMTGMDVLLNKNGFADVFSVWVGNQDVAEGTLTLGGWDESQYTGDINWVDIRKAAYYEVDLHSMAVGEDIVVSHKSKDFGYGIADTGTTYLLFTKKTWDPLKKAFQALKCKYMDADSPYSVWNSYNRSYELTPQEKACFPTIHLYIGNTSIPVGPDLYWWRQGSVGNSYSFGLNQTSQAFTIIGDIVLRGYYVIHDRRTHRLGFATSIHSKVGEKAPPLPAANADLGDGGGLPLYGLVGILVFLGCCFSLTSAVLSAMRRNPRRFWRRRRRGEGSVPLLVQDTL